MHKQIFVNLPVQDLDRSIAFFSSMGYGFNAQFTDDTATCMVVSDVIHVMLLTHDKFAQFTPSPIADAKTATEVLICLSCDSRAAVDALIAKALAGGGTCFGEPQDHGFMYHRSYRDLDGHIWELMYMDPSALAGN